MDAEDAVNESDAPMREAEPGSVHMEPDDDVYKAQAADEFMDDSDDDEDLVRMVKSLNQLGVDLLDAQNICRQHIQRSRNICQSVQARRHF